jgi:molecular chaperone GrpE
MITTELDSLFHICSSHHITKFLRIQELEDDQQGKVIDVVEKGYKLGDKILRYPKVVVGQ